MKPIKLFILKSCPYCRAALGWMDELKKENPQYTSIEINIIDEGEYPEIADKYDYYYVPTYYIEEVKVHEGAASKEIVKAVFDKALE